MAQAASSELALPDLSIAKPLQWANTLCEYAQPLWGGPIYKADLDALNKEFDAGKSGPGTGWDDAYAQDLRKILPIWVEFLNNPEMPFSTRLFHYNRICNNLRARAHVMKYTTDNYTQVTSRKIKKPIFIVGLPRTGTTLLYNLMACDPDSRALHNWEMHPSGCTMPPPNSAQDTAHPNWAKAAKDIGLLTQFCPSMIKELEASHPYAPEILEEDLLVLQQVLFAPVEAPGPRADKLFAYSMEQSSKMAIYEYHHRFIQCLDLGWSPRSHWLFKSPFHSLFFPQLLHFYPDAQFVQCHRDLKAVLPSFCRLSVTALWSFGGNGTVPPHQIAKRTHQLAELILTRTEDYSRSASKPKLPASTKKSYPDSPVSDLDAADDGESYFNDGQTDNGLPSPANTEENDEDEFSLQKIQDSKRPNPQPILDVHYKDLMKDPIGSVCRIYEALGRKVSAAHVHAMKQWIAENPQGKHGRAKYTCQQWGWEEVGWNQSDPQARQDVFERYTRQLRSMITDKPSQ